MDTLRGMLESARSFDVRLFTLGKTDVTIWTVLSVLVGVSLLFIVAGWLRLWIAEKALARSRLDRSTRYAIGTITRYVVLISGFMIIMQTAGINLTTFNVLAGAIGVGIGFGLQDIVKNFISGLIIMFDRPIHIGDRIEIAGVQGEVVAIGARRVTLDTADGITIVVPNSKFVTDSVKNHHSEQSAVSHRLTVNVSRDADPRLAQRLIDEVARENPAIEQEPPPFVRLNMPTGGAFPFELQFWSTRRDRSRDTLLNELHYALHEKLGANNIKLV